MRMLFLLVAATIAISSSAQDLTGIFPFNQDIGNPSLKGSATYDSMMQTYTLKGGGYDVWYAKDEFHYLWEKMNNNFILTADFKLIGEQGNEERKTG